MSTATIDILTAKEFGEKVCAALGLDPADVISLAIHIHSGGPVWVEVKQLTRQIQGEALLEAMQGYRLVPKDAAP
jgi:hypothetical protein